MEIEIPHKWYINITGKGNGFQQKKKEKETPLYRIKQGTG